MNFITDNKRNHFSLRSHIRNEIELFKLILTCVDVEKDLAPCWAAALITCEIIFNIGVIYWR